MQAVADEFAFETLVPGDENLLAISGALKVLDEPGEKYNPLFLFGPPSVGKTHILHALRRKLEDRYPEWNILHLPAGEFLEECEAAWQNDTSVELRQQLWRLDCLMLDDVHLLAKRPAALEELYHAHNRLLADSRQIVLTSRVAPAELADFPLALRSRFQSGLVVGIDRPRERLLRDIVEQRCQVTGLKPTRSAARFLCHELRSVRDLNGVLCQLGEQVNGRAKKVSIGEVKDLLDKHTVDTLSISEIARAACEYFQVEPAKVRSACRRQPLVQARQVAMFLARELTGAPLIEIGAYFGGRDHSTVIYACQKVADAARRNDPFTSKALKEIRATLRGESS